MEAISEPGSAQQIHPFTLASWREQRSEWQKVEQPNTGLGGEPQIVRKKPEKSQLR
jgi:hypothetical protein